jgi:hypothetical protein
LKKGQTRATCHRQFLELRHNSVKPKKGALSSKRYARLTQQPSPRAPGPSAPTVLLPHNIPMIRSPVRASPLLHMDDKQENEDDEDDDDSEDGLLFDDPWANVAEPLTDDALEW